MRTSSEILRFSQALNLLSIFVPKKYKGLKREMKNLFLKKLYQPITFSVYQEWRLSVRTRRQLTFYELNHFRDRLRKYAFKIWSSTLLSCGRRALRSGVFLRCAISRFWSYAGQIKHGRANRTPPDSPSSAQNKKRQERKKAVFVTLETRGELEQKCVPQLFWDGYWGRAGQLLANFFSAPSNSPTSLCGHHSFFSLPSLFWNGDGKQEILRAC